MLEIYDCTLREGEQASGVSFSLDDRVEIARKLDELGVDYIEGGWPVHAEVLDSFSTIRKAVKKAKIVAFGSTSIVEKVEEDKNLEAILKSRADYACIFGKSWKEHVEKQLKISKEENLQKISESIKFLVSKELKVFYDAEHFFDAFKDDSQYALATIVEAAKAGASRLILCDTNGGTLPHEVREILQKTSAYLEQKGVKVKLGVHFHNDCGSALSNALESIEYVNQIQGTINGLGERVGNTDLCTLLPLLVLKMGHKLNIRLKKLNEISRLVYKAANLPPSPTQAFTRRAFTHKGGVHIDATMKGASYEHVKPEMLGLNHELILSSLGGSACVISTAAKFGYKLDKNNVSTKEKINKVLENLLELERKGYDTGNIYAEQYMLIEKFFGNYKKFFFLASWKIDSEEGKSMCKLSGKVNGSSIEVEKNVRGGPVDAVYKAMLEMIRKKYEINVKLIDYKVRIARSQGVESSVRTRIDFASGKERFSTVGISENILKSSIEAIEKGFNYYLNRKYIK